jgi:predicted hotdog family 3-hydroxylacyl-ACP dehydratase
MSFPDIRTLVPHAGPMVLLDRVLAADADSLCAEVTIRADTLFCDGTGVGTWIGIEYMAQAIAAHAGVAALNDGAAVKVGFLLGARRYECSRPLFASGSVLQVFVVRTLQSDNGLGAFECRIEIDGVVAANATITVFLPDNVQDFIGGRSGDAV